MPFYEGTEPFIDENGNEAAQIIDFWRWSCSNLVDNVYRGTLAEFIVARALGIDKIEHWGWDFYDLIYGEIKIEVKSSAYVQYWEQKQFSKPAFDIHETVTMGTRPADIYVFCLLNEKDRERLDPIDLNQWDFYVVATSDINTYFGHQKSVLLSRIEKIVQPVKFSKLKNAVDETGKKILNV